MAENKKPFKETKFGKILLNVLPNVAKGATKVLPDSGVLGVIKNLIDTDPDMSAAETEDADVPNDTVEMWREELRQDIRSGIGKMTSIHQQMLDQQAMLHAPPEIRNEYYRVISRTAIQRAELESKKLAVETKRAELELKMLDLQLRKVEIQEKELANRVSSSEGSDTDQRDMIEEDALASRSQEQVASR